MTVGGGKQALELRRTLEKLWSDVAARVPLTDADDLEGAELALYAADGPLRLAVDRLGHRHLLVPVDNDRGPVPEWQSEGVQLRSVRKVIGETAVRFLDLECRRADLTGVFTGLVADICVAVAKDARLSGTGLVSMLESWRALLGGTRQEWTVPRLAGLYGELLVLEMLLGHDPAAAETWVGPTGAPQDFRRHPNALEVKTTTAAVGRSIRIHGADQLERPATGALTLIWARFAALPGGSADDIPSVVERCLSRAASSSILTMLDQLRLPALTSSELRDVSFELVERRQFDVDDAFPRITPDRFVGGALPAGVQAVEYVIDLDSVPPTGENLTGVLSRFMEDT